MDEQEWFRLAEGNLKAHLRALGRCPRSMASGGGGLEMFAFGEAEIPEFNLCYVHDMAGDDFDAALAACEGFFARLRRGFLLNAAGSEEELMARGWKEVDPFLGMHMDLAALPETSQVGKGVEVRRVQSDAVDDVTEVLCPSWGISSPHRAGVFEMMRGLDISDDGEFKAYVLYVNGVPASSLLILRQENIAGVQLVSTLPEQRGKGLAQHLLISSLADARDRGATHSVLEATKMGVRSYERLGFIGCGWSRYFIPPGIRP